MNRITHHIPEDLLRAYASGTLPYSFSVLIAAHVSLCVDCRAQCEAEELVAGALLEQEQTVALSEGSRERLLQSLAASSPQPAPWRPSGIFPAPVMEALQGEPPRWRMLGGGIRQQILCDDPDGSLRLLYIPAGRAVPEHGHGGLELTLVLQGSFSDSLGRFARGDVEYAHDDVDHQPIADPGEACICLAATDAPLRFHAWLPRLLQPLFRI